MENQQGNIQNSYENNVVKKTKEKSTFRLITQVLILDRLISLWNNLKEILSIFKFYLTFGILPNKKQIPFDKQLQFSGKIIGVYFILSILKIVLLELSDDKLSSSNVFQSIGELFIIVIYYLGTIIFCLLGRIIAFVCYRKYDNREVQAYMLGELNFLFLLYFALMFLGIIGGNIDNTDNWIRGIGWFILFCWTHSFYSYFVVFRKNKLFIRFKPTLIIVPCIIVSIMWFILIFFSIFDSLKFLQILK